MQSCCQNIQTRIFTTSWHICKRCASEKGPILSMSYPRILFPVAAGAVLSLLLSSSLVGQGADVAMLLNPPVSSWPGYHGDYSGRRHSPLTQITPQNVAQLGLAWAFQTGQLAQLKCS